MRVLFGTQGAVICVKPASRQLAAMDALMQICNATQGGASACSVQVSAYCSCVHGRHMDVTNACIGAGCSMPLSMLA